MLLSTTHAELMTYYIDPDAMVCYACYHRDSRSVTQVPCDKIPFRLLLIQNYDRGGFANLYVVRMNARESEQIRSKIMEKYGSVSE